MICLYVCMLKGQKEHSSHQCQNNPQMLLEGKLPGESSLSFQSDKTLSTSPF